MQRFATVGPRLRLALGIWMMAATLAALGPATTEAKPAKKASTVRKATSKKAEEPARMEDAADAFPAFCEEWMQKLVERERHNVGHIKWEEQSQAVKGEYVGYSQQHTCKMADSHVVPVGKIMYTELRYEKRGSNIPEAERSPARPVEATEVTEIFRYDKGKWIY